MEICCAKALPGTHQNVLGMKNMTDLRVQQQKLQAAVTSRHDLVIGYITKTKEVASAVTKGTGDKQSRQSLRD